ncbi:ABC transporter substrate-binding protein [Clostridium thermosuccinogenes]|uniref:ABC transporter substrate-binding protein n=1 Tax=Clostridium thermosuccinogenes TaxID=84032 RepID=A0A2K2FKE2_9CLOT|nr:extracellular solute-binding protein [Pseudoclostridium thermosuccinogenes]PNT99247.1 ABC transporter substrate-binding protein [Pseudoclostridium thermosuccinogenes]
MKVKKHFLTAICALLSLSLVLSGCGSSDKKENGDATDSPTTSSSDSKSNFNETGLPIVNEKITLRFVARKADLAGDYNEMDPIKKLEEMTNIHIDWECIPASVYDEKKNLMLAGGDLPDAFFQTGFSDFDIMTYGANGTLIPLQDLVDKWAPRIKSIWEKRPEVKKGLTMPDGNIYTTHSLEELAFTDPDNPNDAVNIGAVPYFTSINKAWLDKLGIPVPTTLDEFHDALVAFRDRDPNGNGKKDEIPFSFMHMQWCMDIGGLFGSFGLGDNTEHRYVKDGKVHYIAVQPEYKEAISYFHQWYKEGLIDPESFTQDAKAYLSKGKHPDYVLGSYVWWETAEVVGPERQDDYVLLPPLKGPGGKQTQLRHDQGAGARNAFAITKVNKYPEITMRWLNECYEPKLSAELNWGPIGKVFEERDGKLVWLPTPAGETAGEYRQKVCPSGGSPMTVLAEDFEYIEMDPRARVRLDDIKNIYWPYVVNKEYYPSVVFTQEELDVIQGIGEEIKKYTNEQRAKWLTSGGIEEEWDAYVDQLNRMGLNELLNAWQSALDRFNGK